MNKRVVISFFVFFCLLMAAGCGESQVSDSNESNKDNADSIRELRLVSYLPVNSAYTEHVIPMWIDMIESEIDNVSIEWVGGPEAMEAPNMFNNVKSGALDIAFNTAGYSQDQVPIANSLQLVPFPMEEEREIGYYDYLSEKFEKAGVIYLGR